MSHNSERVLTGKVLVVDDLADAVTSLGMLCELYGAQVELAHDGAQAVERAEAFRPDIILMDISMPGMSGYEAARRIRSADWGQATVLIALTGWGRQSDLAAAQAAGFDGHLLKPINPDDMLRTIAELRLRRAGA